MYYITFDLKGEDKGTENPDMYYCEFMPEHTMCIYPVCMYDLLCKTRF